MIQLVVATRNHHKLREIQDILGPQFRCVALDQLSGAPELIECGDTFHANAAAKVRQLAWWLRDNSQAAIGLPELPACVLADDSGLEVDALDGAPGVRSARFAARDGGVSRNSPDADNNAKLLDLLKDVPWQKRTARFRCVLALTEISHRGTGTASPCGSGGEPELGIECFEGVCEGRILLTPAGIGGFGYDPLFVPARHEKSFAELTESAKNQLSHRAVALAKLRNWLLARRRD